MQADVDKWVKLFFSQPIIDIKYVDIGLGHQSFHIESASEASSFTFLLRDEERCQKFIKCFTSKSRVQLFDQTSLVIYECSNVIYVVYLYCYILLLRLHPGHCVFFRKPVGSNK